MGPDGCGCTAARAGKAGRAGCRGDGGGPQCGQPDVDRTGRRARWRALTFRRPASATTCTHSESSQASEIHAVVALPA
nr:MAG TPA: hypothetical protein [Caudoviricetes sp.]